MDQGLQAILTVPPALPILSLQLGPEAQSGREIRAALMVQSAQLGPKVQLAPTLQAHPKVR